MYKIIMDRPRSLVFAKVSGFLDGPMIAQIVAETRRMGIELRAKSGFYDLLCDLTETKVAPLLAADTFSDLLGNTAGKHLWAERVAYLTPSALLRLQIEHSIPADREVRVFCDRRTALGWLSSEPRRIAA